MQIKKLLSIMLSAALFIPVISVSASAYENDSINEQSDAEMKGTIKFDGGEGWENKTVCFYIWDDTTKEHAQRDGWVADDNWGSAKKIGGTQVDGETSVYESYEFDLSGREDHDVFIIFHCRDTGVQTMNCLINNTVFGATAKRNGVMYENPVDSEKLTEGVEFDGGTGVGIEKCITSSGKVQGDIIPQGKTPEGIVAQFVLDYMWQNEKISGEQIVTKKSVADAIAAFGTTKEAVWAEYQTFSSSENYNAEEAEKIIMGTGEYTEPEPQLSSSKGTIKFDAGQSWKDKVVCFYIWDDTTKEWATRDGWVDEDHWGSAKKLAGTLVEGETSVYESYEFDLSGREDHAVFIIFHCRDTGVRTMNCLINSTVFGKTAHRNGKIYDNPVDYEEHAEGVDFEGATGVGIEKKITSTGRIQGDIIAPGKKPERIVAEFILNNLYRSNYFTGEPIVTRRFAANAIASFGTTEEAVWAEYQTFSRDEDYNEEGAKDVIFGTDTDPIINYLGDVDGDGSISSADSLYILRRSVDLESMDAVIDTIADVDGDGEVMSDDSLEVLRFSVGLESDYPIGAAIS